MKTIPNEEALSFDDVSFRPGDLTDIDANKVDLKTELAPGFTLRLPFFSPPMEISEHDLAIRMALEGGMGSVHYAFPDLESQVRECDRVKRHRGKFIDKPRCASPHHTVADVNAMATKWGFGTFFIVDDCRRLIGYSTEGKRMYCLEPDKTPITAKMTPYLHNDQENRLLVAHEDMGADEAFDFMSTHDIKILPKVDAEGRLLGFFPGKDLVEIRMPNSPCTKDGAGRLRVAAAIGKTNDFARAAKLVEAGVDILIIDTASGNHVDVETTTRRLKKDFPTVLVMAGNIATGGAAVRLADAGADLLRVGVGGGSICTTRVVTGTGVPQLSALLEVANSLGSAGHRTKIVADGALRSSGDIAKALAVADMVMFGSLIAGSEEAKGEIFFLHGRRWKSYRGMGSLGAMQSGGVARYDGASQTLVPQGIEGAVEYCGPLAGRLAMLAGGVRAAVAAQGARDLKEFRQKAQFLRVSNSGLKEGHVHDVQIMKEAPNYSTAH